MGLASALGLDSDWNQYAPALDPNGNPVAPIAPNVGLMGGTPQSTYQASNLGLNMADQTGNINAAGTNIGTANSAATMTGQNQGSLAQQLMLQQQGKGPAAELAQQQMMQALSQNQSAAAGTIASARGVDPALAQRLALNAQASQSQNEAGQAAQERLQSQLGATQALGGVLAQQRAGDIGQIGAGVNYLGTGLGGQGQQNNTLVNQNEATQQINANQATNNVNSINLNNSLQQQTDAGNAGASGKLAGGIASGIGDLLNNKAAQSAVSTLLPAAAADGKAAGAFAGPVTTGARPYPGDNKGNDTQPILVQRKETVLPASIADDPEAAKAFVAAINKKHGIKPDMKVAMQELTMLGAKIEALKAKFGEARA